MNQLWAYMIRRVRERHPLKQGLKQRKSRDFKEIQESSGKTSTKTRIETLNVLSYTAQTL